MAAVVITGFMGTGKTRVGEIVARVTKRTFIDIDALVERSEGSTVAEIFRDRGEPYFRACERRAVREAVKNESAVIATGGGTMMDPENAAHLCAAGPVVCLTARPEVLLGRIAAQGGVRPLLDVADPAARLGVLLGERMETYEKVADFFVDTSDRNIDEVARDVVRFLARKDGGEGRAGGRCRS